MAKFKLQEACNRAKEALEHGESERAIAMCQHIVRYYPRCVEAYRLLGEAYLERGDTVTADKLFSYVVQADPQNVLAHIGRAIIREERGDIDAAISEFERAFEIDPAISELREELLRLYTSRFGSEGAKIRTSRVGLAHLYARDYLFPQAINEYHDILRSEPRLDVRVALAQTLWRAGNDTAAADLCNAILQQVPNNLQANLILGQIWLAQGQRDDALALFRRAMDLDPDNTLARSLFESRAGRIMLPPLTYYAAELPKWDGSELSASSELPVGLSEVVELEEDALPAHLVEAAAATAAPEDAPQPVQFTAAEVGGQFAAFESELAAETEADQPSAPLLAETPADRVEASTTAPEDGHTAAPELQRQRLDRSEFMQQLATAGLGAVSPPDQQTPADADAAETAAPTAESISASSEASPEPLDVNSADWLDQLAARTRFDAAVPINSEVTSSPARERSFLDDLLDDEETPAVAPPSGIEATLAGNEQPLQPVITDAAGVEALQPAVSESLSPVTNTVSDAAAQPVANASAAPRRTTGPLPDLDDVPATTDGASHPQPYNPDSPLDILGLFQHDVPDDRKARAAPIEQTTNNPTEPIAVGDPSAPLAATEPPTHIPTAAPSAISSEEDTMPAPSYAEDDEQGRTFEFDWDKEGLPDYLKEFALGESASLAPPPETTPPGPQQAADAEALPSWLTPAPSAPTTAPAAADEGLPSWLTAAPASPPPAAMGGQVSAATPPTTQPNAAMPEIVTAPAAMPVPATSLDDMAGLPDWLTSASPALADQPSAASPQVASTSLPPASPPPASPAPPSDVDMDGLPSWLASAAPASSTSASVPPSTPATSADPTGLDSMDMDGLPSWLTTATPTASAAPSPMSPSAPTAGNDLAGLDSASMEGLPSWLSASPAASTAPAAPSSTLSTPAVPTGSDHADLDNMDMEGLPSWLTPTQIASATAASQPAAPADSLDDLGLPSWLTPEPAASQANPPMLPSNLQPFSFADSGAPITHAGNSMAQSFAAPLDDQPAPPSTSGFGNLQPFSFDDIQFTAPGGSAPSATASTPSPFTFDAAAPSDDLADLEDFVDFLKPAPPVAAQSSMADIPSDLMPFSFDDLDLAAPSQSNVAPPVSFTPAPQAQPFTLADTTPPAMPFTPAAPQAAQDYALPSSLQPFSLDDFDLGTTSAPGITASAAPAANDFSAIAPSSSAFAPTIQDDYGIPGGLKPFSFDDFDNLTSSMPETAAPANIPPAPPTADLADYQLPTDLRPFTLEGERGNAGQSASNDFDFAPFNFDDLLQESPPPSTASAATSISMADLGLADTSPSRSGERPSLLESDLEEPSNVDVRGFSWQQSANREPTAPLVTASAEDEGGSMFAKLRRRKEELERNEPAADEPLSSVPPVGAPLSDEERNELTMMNWPMELQDMDAAPTAPVSEPSWLAAPEVAMPIEPISPPATDYAIGASSAQPESQIETSAAGSDEFDLSGLDLSPEERAYLLGEDLPIAGLEAVRQQQVEAGTGDYLLEQQSAASAEQMVQQSAPSDEQLEAAIERDFVMPIAELQAATSEPLAAATEPDFVMPMAEQQAAPATDYQPAASGDAGVTSFASQIRDALDRVGSGPTYNPPAADMDMATTPAAEAPTADEPATSSARERWVDFLASPPRPPIEIPTAELDAAQAEAEPEFADMYAAPAAEQSDISFALPTAEAASAPAPAAEAEAVEADYVVNDAQPVAAVETTSPTMPTIEPASTYVSPAPPTAQPSSYVSPAAPVVPPSAYVSPARPLYMDNLPAAPTPTPTLPRDGWGSQVATPPPNAVQDASAVTASATPPAEDALIEQITPLEPTRPTPAPRPTPPSYAPTLPADELNSVSALRNFVDANRDDVTARLVLARAYENNDDYDNALEQYRLIVKSKSVPASTLEDVVSNLQDMLTVEEIGNNPRAHRVLGDAYMKQGLFQHAISQYNWLLSK